MGKLCCHNRADKAQNVSCQKNNNFSASDAKCTQYQKCCEHNYIKQHGAEYSVAPDSKKGVGNDVGDKKEKAVYQFFIKTPPDVKRRLPF